MAKRLSDREISQFERDGILFPIPVFDRAEIDDRRARFEAIEANRAGRLPPSLNLKAHLVVPWLWDMVHDARILDAVEDVLGPNILCWAASFFAKGIDDPHHVPWHQDATYWGLSEPRAVTAWVAFTPSVRENGCMRVVPGTHARQIDHRDTRDRFNMLPGREEIAVDVDEADAVDVVLAPGEMSLHHLLLIHGSEPNRAGYRRIGFAIRYIAGDLHQTGGIRGSATLVRGRDFGNFDLEQAPEGEFHPDAVARNNAILKTWMKMVLPKPGTAKAPRQPVGD